MIAIGMAIGYASSPNTAPALANFLYLPMLFLSGIFVLLKQLPDTIQHIGSVLPLPLCRAGLENHRRE